MTKADSPAISVLMVTAGRRRDLRRCLKGLVGQVDAPAWELLVCANGDDSATADVRDFFPEAILRSIPKVHPGTARNELLPLARGELVLFLDDDVEPEGHLLHRLYQLGEQHPDIGVFGGPNLTPRGSSTFQLVQGAVLASLISSGPVRRRYGPHPARTADERFFMLCNMAVRRVLLMEFDDDLICAEENRLLNELQRRGAMMLYDPSLVVFHERRPDLPSLTRQLFKYGVGRGQVAMRDPRSIRLAHVVPVALTTYLLTLPLSAWLISPWTMLPALVYLALAVINGAIVAITLRRAWVVLLAVALTLLVHVTYACGIVYGILRSLRSRVERNRA